MYDIYLDCNSFSSDCAPPSGEKTEQLAETVLWKLNIVALLQTTNLHSCLKDVSASVWLKLSSLG